jgi:serine/threonine-protein kinase
MDERCKVAHAKLLAGTCPWCGHFIVGGKVEGQPERYKTGPSEKQHDVESVRETLEARVRSRGVLSSDEAVFVVETIANELMRLHKTGQVHRALSPNQILILDGDQFFLSTARYAVGAAESVSELDEPDVIGVADYLAPEQALNSSQPDHRSDIYSLGCILYFMLTGSAPFGIGSISERLLKHQTKQPTPISSLRGNVPACLIAICTKMMEKKPQNRYQSTEELISAINAWKAEGP